MAFNWLLENPVTESCSICFPCLSTHQTIKSLSTCMDTSVFIKAHRRWLGAVQTFYTVKIESKCFWGIKFQCSWNHWVWPGDGYIGGLTWQSNELPLIWRNVSHRISLTETKRQQSHSLVLFWMFASRGPHTVPLMKVSFLSDMQEAKSTVTIQFSTFHDCSSTAGAETTHTSGW